MEPRSGCIALLMSVVCLAAPHTALAVLPCPILSGNYLFQGEDGQVHISIKQRGCGRIEIVRKSSYLGTVTAEAHSLRLNGHEQRDASRYGSREQHTTSARFVKSELHIEARTIGGPILTVIYYLTPSRDLVEDTRTGGQSSQLLFERQ